MTHQMCWCPQCQKNHFIYLNMGTYLVYGCPYFYYYNDLQRFLFANSQIPRVNLPSRKIGKRKYKIKIEDISTGDL